MSGLFRNTFFVTLSQLWQMIMALTMMPFASRYLGVEGFGKYNTATVIMFYVFLLNDFGLNTWITRELARERDKTRSTLAYAFGLKLCMILPCAAFLLVYYLLTDYDQQTYQAIWIFAVFGVVDSFTQMGYAIFRSRERMELEMIVAVMAKTLLTGLAILALVLGWGLLAFAAMFVLSTVAGLIVSLSLIRKHFAPLGLHFDAARYRRMLTLSANFGLALFIASSYEKLDVLMLSWMKDMDTVGLYSAPSKLLSFTNLIPTIFATAFFPQMARFVSNKAELSRIFSIAVKHLLMLAIPLVAGIYMISDQLTVLVFGSAFGDSAVVLRILSFAAGILFINLFLASLYGATNHQGKIVQIEIIALVLKIIVNLLLIPEYSYRGAAWSTVATESLVLVLALSWALRHIASISGLSFFGKFLAATAGMCAGLYFMSAWPLLASVAGAVLIYFLLLFVTRALDVNQIKQYLVHLL